jgi:hypothetical protein
VTGKTASTNFPTASSPHQSSRNGATDAFYTKLNSGGTGLAYSTYLGGGGDDFGWGIAVDSGGNAYVTGNTASTSFPTTSGRYQSALKGTSDAFVSKFAYDELTVPHTRWRNDNGSESAATWVVAEDKKIGIRKGTTKRLRFLVSNQGNSLDASFEIGVAETATCSSGTYNTVLDPLSSCSGATCHWRLTESTYYSDWDPTTNVASGLTDPTGYTFVAGQIMDNWWYNDPNITLATNQFTEVEWALQPQSAATTNGNYCFRLTEYWGGTFTSYAYAEVKVLGATAVDLIAFTATGAGGEVRVEWQTGEESENKGFEVYRAESPGGPFTKLNSGMIASASVSGEGHGYEFLDATAVPGRLYYYRLKDVDV